VTISLLLKRYHLPVARQFGQNEAEGSFNGIAASVQQY